MNLSREVAIKLQDLSSNKMIAKCTHHGPGNPQEMYPCSLALLSKAMMYQQPLSHIGGTRPAGMEHLPLQPCGKGGRKREKEQLAEGHSAVSAQLQALGISVCSR